jgi:signal peptidase II
LRRSRSWIFFIVLILMLVVDQLVKSWARHSMVEAGSIALPWPGVFELKLTYNEGVAFGFLQGAGRMLAPIAVAIAVGAGWYSIRHPKDSASSHIAMGLLAAGALGNLYDRLFNGRVTDMFYARIIDFPVFNVADACITVATCLLMIIWWREATKPKETVATPSAVHVSDASDADLG